MVFLHPLILTLLYLLQEAQFIESYYNHSFEIPFTKVRRGMDLSAFDLTSYQAISLPGNYRGS